ncbi:MAG: MBL fold metallo-hydrolase, partial [Acidobacteria bacterium]|nr:MBL fold metallo-hydrolase [Acidobacteriota bacterium]
MKLAAVAVALFLAVSQAQRPDTLRIYVVDVEGGGATLVISPGGQSMLIDSG